ncbi:PspC domain-containing protein [Actinomyces sp. B33]|uniref:ATP-binding protein n=1 Tax=Actinomyces sp. B33 TaxID=2942131 RepID=UPI00234049FF|nr:ATP-binding protein [Actinomyces sp. B33]MDC4233718.1 PspC domain-containing protein [Actinomyces sp. B33]
MPTPWMAGVCSGLAVHTGMSVGAVRMVMAVLAPALGVSVVLYLWLWVMVPKDGDPGSAARARGIGARLSALGTDRSRATSRSQLLMAGTLMVVLSTMALILASSGVVDLRDILSTALIVIGIGLVWSQGGRLALARTPSFLGIVSVGVLMLIIGLVAVVGRNDPPLILLRGGLIGAVVIAGVLFALTPLWLRTNKDLSASQEQQVRDAERADIAAHLHDSVLQSLTLIRASADDPVRVRSLALTEERELRSWLYTGREEPAASLGQAVSEAAGQVESRYGVPVEVVTVGDTVPGPAELALVAALGEAVANAVRHGAPPVSVFLEVRPDVIEAFIKDAGPGFDLAAVPDDRHGVRDSIFGRMERVGGTASVRVRASGTEIGLRLPRTPLDIPTPILT